MKTWKRIESWIGTPKSAHAIFNDSFDRAKKLSDFVGIITRLVFLQLFLQFINSDQIEMNNTIKYIASGYVFILFFWLFSRFSRVIFDFFMHDVSEQKPGFGKFIVFVVGAFSAFVIPISIVFVVFQFAEQVSN